LVLERKAISLFEESGCEWQLIAVLAGPSYPSSMPLKVAIDHDRDS